MTITLDFENEDGTHEKREYLYKRGIVDYMNEIISADGGYNPSEEAEEAEEQAAETDEADETEEAEEETAEASKPRKTPHAPMRSLFRPILRLNAAVKTVET